MRSLAGAVMLVGFSLLAQIASASDPRIKEEMAETGPVVIPLQQALGAKALEEAMATGKYAYTGNSKCRLCHREFFIGRKKDPHDHTFRKLIDTPYVDNPKCLNCHSTGFGVQGGFVSFRKTPWLANVQCEGCHGPGSEHIRLDAKGGFLAGSDRPEILEKMCHSCHTERWDRSYHDFQEAYDSYKTARPGE